MIRWLRSTLHPAVYHGHGKEPPFFEGWYYKLVDASEHHRQADRASAHRRRGERNQA